MRLTSFQSWPVYQFRHGGKGLHWVFAHRLDGGSTPHLAGPTLRRKPSAQVGLSRRLGYMSGGGIDASYIFIVIISAGT